MASSTIKTLWQISSATQSFLLTQLFLLLTMWPIFLWSGIALSPLSMIGNLLFGPFLSIFLLLCTFIFFSELLHIPNNWIIYCLEHFCSFWFQILDCTQYNYPIVYSKPPLLLMLCIPICALIILHYRQLYKPYQKILFFSITYSIFALIFSFLPQPTMSFLDFGSHTITLTQNKNQQITLHDTGFNKRKSSIDQWINYTLLPHLAQKFGRQTLDHIKTTKKTGSTLLLIEKLKEKKILKKG